MFIGVYRISKSSARGHAGQIIIKMILAVKHTAYLYTVKIF